MNRNKIALCLIDYHCSEEVKKIINKVKEFDIDVSIYVYINDFHEQTPVYDEDITVLSSKENLGYCGGNNKLWDAVNKRDDIKYTIIANSDIDFTEHSVASCIQYLNDNKQCAQVYIPAVDDRSRILYTAISLDGLMQSWSKSVEKEALKSDYAPGSFFMIRNSSVGDMLLFDENYFLYWEEVDLSLRLRNKGFQITCLTTHRLSRLPNKKSGIERSFYYRMRNAFYLRRKFNIGHINLMRYSISLFTNALTVSIRFKSLKALKYLLWGMFNGFIKQIGIKSEVHD